MDEALIQFPANIKYMIEEVEKGGDVRITTYIQEDGPYVTVSGLGVNAGGFRQWQKPYEVGEKQRKGASVE